MKNILFTVFILMMMPLSAQERLDLKGIGFSMDLPKDWFMLENEEAILNLKRFDLTDQQLKDLLKGDKYGTTLLTTTKYNLKKHSGVSPTIKLRTIPNEINNIKDFRKAIEVSNESLKNTLDNFKISEGPSIINLGGSDTLKLTVEFTMKGGSKNYPIVSHTYYILRKDYYISLNFIEESGKEDNTSLFNTLISSIVIK